MCPTANVLYAIWVENQNNWTRSAFECHLAACPVCRADIETTRALAEAQDWTKEPPVEEEK